MGISSKRKTLQCLQKFNKNDQNIFWHLNLNFSLPDDAMWCVKQIKEVLRPSKRIIYIKFVNLEEKYLSEEEKLWVL